MNRPETSPDFRPLRGGRVVLLATPSEQTAAAVAGVLERGRYELLLASTGGDALRQASSANPDAILIDAAVPDIPALALCKALREQRAVDAGAAVIVLTDSAPRGADQMDALRAGAWDCLGPADLPILVFKLEAFARVRTAAAPPPDDELLDRATGLYSCQGLARRARELSAQAFRQHTALACVVFSLDPENQGRLVAPQTIDALAASLRMNTRASDALGRLGSADFGLLAPGAGMSGAAVIARRLGRILEQTAERAGGSPSAPVQASLDAIENLAYSPADPMEFIAVITRRLQAPRSAPPSGGASAARDS
jgi:DNA-binding response OmpR family regulator